MTAAELITQINALEPKERAQVLRFLLQFEGAKASSPMDDQCFDQASERVIKDHADLLRKLAQ
jgi:hypothetical protein